MLLWLLLLACDGGVAVEGDCDPYGELEPGTELGEPNGTCAPEGEAYTDHYSCEGVVAPCRGDAEAGAQARVEPDEAREADTDLPWVLGQLESCSCSCCHNVEGEAAHIWAWDFEPVWTDSLETDGLTRVLDGYGRHDNLVPGDNNGFTREGADFPTTDPDRLRAYLQRELERRE